VKYYSVLNFAVIIASYYLGCAKKRKFYQNVYRMTKFVDVMTKFAIWERSHAMPSSQIAAWQMCELIWWYNKTQIWPNFEIRGLLYALPLDRMGINLAANLDLPYIFLCQV